MNIFKQTHFWLMAFTLSSLLILTACQHNENSLNETTTESQSLSELTIELTDAEGDFSTYLVDVLSITLTKKDNSIVEVLPDITRVDFAQYVEMSELLSSASVPVGTYTSATLTLDYSNADIFAENAAGDNIQVTSIVDENNEAITTVVSKVTLDERNQLQIIPGVIAHLSLDFDLKVSNTVSFDEPDAPVLTVAPVLHASLEPDMDKTHRVRGPLKSVDLDDSQFSLIVRPFNNRFTNSRFTKKREHFGRKNISIDEDTTFEINGEGFIGIDGLTAMNDLDKLTAVIAVGEFTLRPRRFIATEVYVGSSVPGGDMDVVRGTVLNRTGNTLTIKGATLIRTGGSVIFNDLVTINLDETTDVRRQQDSDTFTIDDISVGQRILAFGSLNDDTSNLTLDTTDGLVRLLITEISGIVVNDDTSSFFTLNLNKINGRKIELFDFSGTGISAENDANPTSYEVETSTLDLTEFLTDTKVNVRGFVNNFNQAPADFIAYSINNTLNFKPGKKSIQKKRRHGNHKSIKDDNSQRKNADKMQVNWNPASNSAFSLISSDKITLDFTGAGLFHHVGNGRKRMDLATLETDFSFTPVVAEENSWFLIQRREANRIHTNFENLSTDLINLINEGNEIISIQARGEFDLETGDFMAKEMKIKMK